MIRSRTALYLGTPLLLASIVLGGASCSNKQLSSSSSDQSTTSADQPAPEPIQHERTQPESIQPERIASIEPPAAASAEPPAYREESRSNTSSPSTTQANSVPPGAAALLSEPEAVKSQDITKFEDIYFNFDQYNIRSDAQSALERNGQWILKEKHKTLLIEGHCDERGTLAYNLVLGEKRAKSAKQYLERLGIPASRLHTTSYGEVRPSCKEHNEGCWKYNRRAHFIGQ